ncbi:MAG TPA: MlaD family protein [Oligoflexia bacterium]|nr:MlaD family protein [Oligoflexia bacterium]HMP48768.1 MlaD family protein [Oligoflexia bacterium]
MESEVHYKRVGGFILSAILVFLGIIVWLTGIGASERVNRYHVFFKMQSLDGLQKDSLVTMRGIRVGVVEDYEIAGDDIERVSVVLKLEEGVPVKIDTRAVIRRNLLTGLAKIDLVGGTQAAPLLDNNSLKGGSYPVIREEIPQIEKIANSVPELLEKVELLMSRLDALLSEDNVKAISQTMLSLNTFTNDLASSGPSLAKTLNNLEQVTLQASKAVGKISGDDGRGGDSGRGVVDELALAVSEARELVSEFRKLNSSLSPSIRRVSRAVGGVQRDVGRVADGVNAVADGYSDPRSFLAEPD